MNTTSVVHFQYVHPVMKSLAASAQATIEENKE